MKGPNIRLILHGVAAAIGALAIAGSLMIHPALSLALALGVVGVGYGAVAPTAAARTYLWTMASMLLAFGLFGRGFAHWGIKPLFVGEIVLATGLALLVPGGTIWRPWGSPIIWAWAIFAAWGAIRTVGFLGTYGLSSLRDAALWGYGVFAVFIAAALMRLGWTERVVPLYRRWLPWLLVVSPIVLILTRVLGAVPLFPGSGVPIVQQKPGDVCVHLAGIGIFLMLGLDRSTERRDGVRPGSLRGLWWVLWMGAFTLAAALSRGGMLAAGVALLLALAFARSIPSLALLYKPALVATLMISAVVFFDAKIDLGGNRDVSTEQLVANLRSMTGTSDRAYLTDTSDWRLSWWGDIVDYTVFGPYFWTGKGYGINLEEADGYKTLMGEESRNPHSAHFTVLARSGVPGLILWIVFLATFSLQLLRRFRILTAEGHARQAAVLLWVWTYWVAFLVNGAFDIYLEGPQGGIWFWSLTGVGVALLHHYDSARPASVAFFSTARTGS